MNKLQTNIWVEATALGVVKDKHDQTYGQKNFYSRGEQGKKSGAPTDSQYSKVKCIYCKLNGHLKEFCLKKYPKKVLNRNKSNRSSSDKDKDSNRNLEKRKHKDRKSFAESAVIFHSKINMIAIGNNNFSAFGSFATSLMAPFDNKNS